MAAKAEPTHQSDLAGAALRFARRVHLGQHRKQTHEQFVEHPIAVARLLIGAGLDGPIVVAAYLHDVVEKTPVSLAEIAERFGPLVAETVGVLSEDPSIERYAERKRRLRQRVLEGDRDARLIYAADRVVNMRDWRTLPPDRREACAERLGTALGERIELWVEDLDQLSAADPELCFLAEMEIELRALRAEASGCS